MDDFGHLSRSLQSKHLLFTVFIILTAFWNNGQRRYVIAKNVWSLDYEFMICEFKFEYNTMAIYSIERYK